MSQEALLARRRASTRPKISRLERAKREPRLTTVLRLARASHATAATSSMGLLVHRRPSLPPPLTSCRFGGPNPTARFAAG